MGFWEFKGLAGVGSYYGLEIEEKSNYLPKEYDVFLRKRERDN